MYEHIRIFGALFNLLIGTVIAVYVYQLVKSYSYLFLKPILHHIIFFNLIILSLLFAKYLGINLPETFLPNMPASFKELFFFVAIIFIYGMLYSMVKIFLGFKGKELAARYNKIFVTGIILLVFFYVAKLIYPNDKLIVGWFIGMCVSLLLIAFLTEFVLLISLLIHGKRNPDRGKAKISKAFGYLHLSRYAIMTSLIFVVLVFKPLSETSQAFLASGFLLYFNIIPFLWFKFFFLDYAESMLEFVEGKAVLEPAFEKYNISKREREILKLILDGKGNKEIEDTLFISYHTVKNHVYNLYQKLGVKTRYELVHFFTKFEKAGK